MSRLLLGILLLIAGTTAQASAAGAKMQDGQPAGSAAVPKNSDLPSEIELLFTRYRFENDGTGRKEVIAKIRILNQRGALQQGEMTFEYRPFSEELQIPYVRVRKKDGAVVAVETGAVQPPPKGVGPEYDYDEKRVRIPELAPGDLIEYKVVNILRRPLGPGEFYVHHNFEPGAVVDEQLEVDVPRDRKVMVKCIPGVKSWETGDSTREVYHWRNLNLEPLQTDEFAWARTPDVQVSSFLSWEEVGRWYADLVKSQHSPSPEVRAKAAELTKGLNSDTDRVEALYNFAAKKIKYLSLVSLGIGGFAPYSASETIHHGYGDCKDKTALLIALLEAEDLHASSVLISPDRKLDLETPSPWPFNHVITMLRLGKEEIWMDPSSAVLPFRMLAYSLRSKQGLVIPPEGAPRFEETPAEASVPNTWSEEIEGNVSENGTLDATVKITVRGDAALPMRQAFIGPVESVWPVTVRGVVKGISRNADKISDVSISDPIDTNQPFALSFRISKPLFIQVGEKQFEVRLPLADFQLAAVEGDGIRERHRTPSEGVNLGPVGEQNYRIRLALAPRFTLDIPLNVALERDYSNYYARYQVKSNLLTAERKLITRENELPSTLAVDYSGFREKVLADAERGITVQLAKWGGEAPK